MKWLLFLALSTNATSSQDAVNTGALAIYRYEHWDQDVAYFLNQYEKSFTPKEKQAAAVLYYIANAAIQRQITVTFRFP